MNLKFSTKLEEFTEHKESSSDRREVILSVMRDQFSQGKNCNGCQGYCCTSFHNSMQVTILEAFDLFFYLKRENRLTQELVDNLKSNIKKYRLDYVINTGRNSSFRRSYTCPFFVAGSKGCTIDPEFKPYGCLAFNPLKENVSTEGYCASNLKLLENRESLKDDQLNLKLKSDLRLSWEKESIPVALLNLIELFEYKT